MTPESIGDYRILELLGQGGMGRVYRAEPLAGGEPVALKVLLGSVTDPGALRRFEREEQVLAELEHPGIVRALSPLVCEAERAYYAMELVEGGDFGQEIRATGGLEPQRAIEVAVRVLDALGAAHARGVVHRDVKPSNLLLDADGCVRLADFGLASVQNASGLTRTGTVLGTPEYMSPEQADGAVADARADLYAVGVVLFEALAGRPPFRAEKPLALLRQHLDAPVPPLVSRHPLPSGLEGVIRRALEKRPAARWSDAASMADALRAVAQNPPASSDMPDTVILGGGAARETASVALEPRPPSVEEVQARTRGGLALVLGALGLGAAGLAGWGLSGRTPPTPPGPSADTAPVVSEAPAERRVEVALQSGGVIRGVLVELDLPGGQAVVRQPDGTVQRLSLDAVAELRYPDD